MGVRPAHPVFGRQSRAGTPAAVFEILHGSLMFLRRGAGLECAEVAALAGLGILLARVEAVTAGRKFATHRIAP